MPMSRAPVGGVDLGDVSSALAERAGVALVATAHDLGIDTDPLVVGGHQIIGRHGVLHRVLTVAGEGLGADDLRQMCSAALDHTAEAEAVVVGRYRAGQSDAVGAARSAVHERVLRIGGQSLFFPGKESLTGVLTVAEIVDRSAVEAVAEVGGALLNHDEEVEMAGCVRPRWSFGPLTLHVQAADEQAGLYRPFEADPRVRV